MCALVCVCVFPGVSALLEILALFRLQAHTNTNTQKHGTTHAEAREKNCIITSLQQPPS